MYGEPTGSRAGRVVKSSKILFCIACVTVIFPVFASLAGDSAHFKISEITYTEKEIQEISPISPGDEKLIHSKVDELIELLESHKRAAAEGRGIDDLQKTVNRINELIEEQKTGPSKLSINRFHGGICFKCHAPNDFSPSDKTRNEWQYLIEDDGHAIFENIPWENSSQKKQIVEFLIENAGNHRAEGIGLWN